MSKIIKPVKRVYTPTDAVTFENVGDVFSFVMVGGKARIVRHIPTAIDKNALTPEFIAPSEFTKMFMNKRRKVTIKKHPDDFMGEDTEVMLTPAGYFLHNKKRRTFDRMVFEANTERVLPSDYNMWNGFALTPKKGDWSLMHAMIEESIADGDIESYLWIIRFCAWCIQNPTERAGVCLAMLSEKQGTGKGLLGRTMCKLFGAHAQHMYRQNSVTARFNAQLAQCAMLFEDESDFAGDKAAASMMKGLITEPTIDIERKGIDVITLPNCLKIIKATNRKWVAPVEAGDRRYAVFHTCEKWANNKSYFGPIYGQLDNEEDTANRNAGYRAMLHDLMHWPLKGWKPSDEIPNTVARAEQKAMTLPDEDKWLLGYLESGILPYTNPKWPNRMNSQIKFYADAKRFSKELSHWGNDRLSQHLNKWGILSKTSNGHYRDFGSLADLRARFRTAYPWYPAFRDEVTEWTYSRDDHEGDFDGE